MPNLQRVLILLCVCWGFAGAVIETAQAQISRRCENMLDRLARQQRIDDVLKCEVVTGRLEGLDVQADMRRRCNRNTLREVSRLWKRRANALERCILKQIENGRFSAAQNETPMTRGTNERVGEDRPGRSQTGDRVRELLGNRSEPLVARPLRGRSNQNVQELLNGLVWSFAGPIEGMHCVQWREPSDPHNWNDNFLCSERNAGFQWSFRGPILGRGLKCIQVNEKADPHDWHDNYFCWPRDLKVRFRFSSTGRIHGFRCLAIIEPSDPHTWHDNYLCHRSTESPG